MKHENPVLYYDGTCGLCDRIVRFISARTDEIDIIPNSKMPSEISESMDTDSVVYLREGQYFDKSLAVLEVFKDMGKPYSFLYWFRWLPPKVRDFLYLLIAKNRYRFFGKREEVCELESQKK